jgi:uncharacterized membrane protein
VGVLFDFDKMTAAVPDDKVERTLGMVEKVLQETWVPVMDVMSLLGLLVHCGQILVSGSWNTAWTVNALRAGVRGLRPGELDVARRVAMVEVALGVLASSDFDGAAGVVDTVARGTLGPLHGC